MPRKKPYSAIGIKRLKCFRCGEQAKQQWQVCADDNTYRPICDDCDIALNELVLRFMGDKDAGKKMAAYRQKMKGGESR